MKKHILLSLTLTVLTSQAYAQRTIEIEDCDTDTQDCSSTGSIKEPVKTIYPYLPFTTSQIDERLNALTEGAGYISNVYEMERKNLNKANTKVRPWGGSFWPLYQGMVGNTYQDKDFDTFLFSIGKNLNWQKNVRVYKKRVKNVHSKIYDLSEEDLAKLAPSEKYDIMLGDTTFDLTNRVWAYTEKWGNEKKWGFLSSIDLPDGYRIPKGNTLMALWEGICHGWAVAAGHSPRPEKTVTVTLPNGKKMPIYPNDTKALVSLMWAHSNVQSNVIFEGNRCNKKSPDKDKFGRYIDIEKDRNDDELTPRCADVHPAIMHVAMINLLGVEGRSFIVDHNPKATISNQPLSGYELTYFNPSTGKESNLAASVVSRASYGPDADPYYVSRNPESTHIVGVSTKMYYVDWEFPKLELTNTEANDKIKSFDFNYDLELNASGKIIGGQWRVKKNGSEGILTGSTDQPDFFWVIPRDWKNYFKPLDFLPKWDFSKSTLPPKEYSEAAKSAHAFVFEESEKFFRDSPKCPVFPLDGGDPIKVNCSFKYPRPQPLVNVIDTLVNEARK